MRSLATARTLHWVADPYEVLGVGRDAADAEVRAAYRRLVQRHHPDHNRGSAESARRFEDVQEAYARIRELRMATSRQAPPASGARAGGAGGARAEAGRSAGRQPPGPMPDPEIETRLADLERAVREAHEARERSRRAAAEAAKATGPERPSDEELGYVTTDDSFAKIFDDALSTLSHKLSGARESSIGKRVEDLIEDLDFLHQHGDDKRE